MSDGLTQAMATATDEELFAILHLNRAEYSEQAIALAEKELHSRNLGPDRLAELQADVDRKRQRAVEPLSWPLRVVFILCGLMCLGIPLIPVAVFLEVAFRDADRKYREAWRYTGYGFAVAIVLAVVLYGLPVILWLFLRLLELAS